MPFSNLQSSSLLAKILKNNMVAGLLIGHFGHIGKMDLKISKQTLNLLRERGLGNREPLPGEVRPALEFVVDVVHPAVLDVEKILNQRQFLRPERHVQGRASREKADIRPDALVF